MSDRDAAKTAVWDVDARVILEYPQLRVNLHLQAARGEVVGLVGPNGAGKTTVLRVLAGLTPIDDGRITISGVVVDDPATGVLVAPQQRRVGFVFQDYRLFPHLDALDNVAFGLRAAGRCSRKNARVLAAQWLDRVGLAEHRSHRPGALSGGQQQRVALARALAPEPEVLLLDEPFAAIDAGASDGLRADLLRYLEGFAGLTFLVSHKRDDIAAMASRVAVFDRGTISWSGLTADLPAR